MMLTIRLDDRDDGGVNIEVDWCRAAAESVDASKAAKYAIGLLDMIAGENDVKITGTESETP